MVPWRRSVTVVVLRVDEVIVRENVAVGEMLGATPVASAAGVVAVTVGAGWLGAGIGPGAAGCAPGPTRSPVIAAPPVRGTWAHSHMQQLTK